MPSTETPLVPDVDGLCSVRTHLAEPTVLRLRVWSAELVALVEDSPTNVGMSVTNAIESLATFLEADLGVWFADAPHAGAAWSGWQLVQHNPRSEMHRFDLVSFAARSTPTGALALPRWTPLPGGLMEWLFVSVVSAS